VIRFGSGFGFVAHPRVVLVLAPLLVELLGQPLRDDARHLPGAFEGRAVGRRALCAHNARGAAAHVGATVAHVGAKVAQVGATVARRQLKGRRQRRGHGEEERWDAHSRRCPGGCERADWAPGSLTELRPPLTWIDFAVLPQSALLPQLQLQHE